ncbi:hypothetical protein FQN49_001887, partial [Arthroderma sp. PD_2]
MEVVSGISAVIGIIDASVKIYNNARKDMKLPETFEVVGCQLPIILDTLQSYKTHITSNKESIPTDVCESLEKTIDKCKEKTKKMREIFEEIIAGEKDGWERRYLKAIRKLGKGNKVEELMISITKDVQLLVNHHAVKFTDGGRDSKLGDMIKEMKCVESSVPDDETAAMIFNNSGRAQTNSIINNNGDGYQVINHAAVHTQTFVTHEQKRDFSFREPVGVHLGRAPRIDSSLFIGRNSELNNMRNILNPGHKSLEQRRLVLGGVGGIGKTQLAIAYAKFHRNVYTSIFWLNATTEATLEESFRLAAEQIFGVQKPGDFEDQQSVACQWLSDRNNMQWLLIFDNYDEPGKFGIEKYYPHASHGAIIITTRRPDLVAGTHMQIHSLQNTEESLAILQTRSLRKDVISGNLLIDPYARLLAERLGGFPLALATAGTYLKYSSLTLECYLQEYQKRWGMEPPPLQEYRDCTLYTTWDLSYNSLERSAPDAAKLLKLLAYFDNQSISYELLRAGLSNEPLEWLHKLYVEDALCFDKLMGILTKYGFLEVQAELGSWRMHNCVHDWTLAVLNKDIDAEQYWYAFDCIAGSINEEDTEHLASLSYSRLAAHALWLEQPRFLQNNLPDKIATARLDSAARIALLLKKQVHPRAAAVAYRRVLNGMEKALGFDHISTLLVVREVGHLFAGQGKLAEAEEMYLRALRGFQANFGPDYIEKFRVLGDLGSLYCGQDKQDEAEE